MNKTLKYAAVAGLLAASLPATAQIMRPRPVITPTGPVKPVTVLQVRPLTKEELQRRIKTPPRYFTPAELKARIPPKVSAGPDLTSAFSLTPAVQTVSGRGSMKIEGSVTVPNPVPPGFPGQAVVSYSASGKNVYGQSGPYGGVWLTLSAQQGKFYVVDCLAAIHRGNTSVFYEVSGADTLQSGTLAIASGHLVFTARRSQSDGDIKIKFRPDEFKVLDWNDRDLDLNVIDFWGCQISTAN